MNDNDYIQLYDLLLDVLRGRGLIWITDQVFEEIRLGKTEITEVELFEGSSVQSAVQSVFSDMGTHRIKSRRSKKEAFLKTREYTSKERLLILIDAIEHAVVNTSLMVHETVEYFGEEHRIQAITFYSEEDQTFKTFTKSDGDQRLSSSLHLKTLLGQLRRQISAN